MKRDPAKALPKRTRKAVAKIAKTVMTRQVETNYVCDNQELNYVAVYGDSLPAAGAPQLYACLPQVIQGDTSDTREGIKIRPTKHCTDLRFTFGTDALITPPGGGGPVRVDSAAWDITVHIWYGYVKRYKGMADVLVNGTQIINSLLEVDGGTLARWSGRLADETFERNSEFSSVKHKQFRMFKNAGLPNVLDTVIPAQNFPVQDATRVRLTFKPPKTLGYAQDSAVYPENYAPFMIVGYCHNDATQAANSNNAGATNNISQVPAIQMLQVNKLWYKDA